MFPLQKNRRIKMDKKKIDFIIQYFGCKTPINGEMVLTSLANASRVPVEEFWDVFSSDAERIFDIRVSEFKNEIHLTLDERIRKNIERELGLR